MKTIKAIITATLTITALGATSMANAALIGRLAATPGGTDYQAYYDDVADLTWLANANAADTTMNWADANRWAADLDVAGVDGWRLPTTVPNEGFTVYGPTDSEMSNLWYNVLQNELGLFINTGPFSNVQYGSSTAYWTATEVYLPGSMDATGQAWVFDMGDSFQGTSVKSSEEYAWAVQSGDVSAVPVPAAVWLFGSGLLGLVGVARRKSANI